jgi:hypothetical protein
MPSPSRGQSGGKDNIEGIAESQEAKLTATGLLIALALDHCLALAASQS